MLEAPDSFWSATFEDDTACLAQRKGNGAYT